MCLCLWSCSFLHCVAYYGAQVVQALPGPHKSLCQYCTYLGGDVLQLDPLRLTVCLSLIVLVSKKVWKGKVDLDRERLPLHSDEGVTYFKFIFKLLLPLYSYWKFWWGNGVLGPRLIPFWCLMPKGEKIKAKAINGSATTWEIFENSRIELLVCQNSVVVSLVKSWLLVGRNIDYGK